MSSRVIVLSVGLPAVLRAGLGAAWDGMAAGVGVEFAGPMVHARSLHLAPQQGALRIL